MTVAYGFAERRAVRARAMTRTEWQAMCRGLRAAMRGDNPRTHMRAARLLQELCRDTGCQLSERVASTSSDVLQQRQHGTSAEFTSMAHVVRARLCVQWYPMLPAQTAGYFARRTA